MFNVFIVEDEPILQRLYSMAIEAAGYKVIGRASNGKEAIDKFKKFLEIPHIILMDYRMPLKNGIEAAKEILRINPNPKIIFTTADESVREEALSLGAVSFKSKPFSNKRLIQNIEKALGISYISSI